MSEPSAMRDGLTLDERAYTLGAFRVVGEIGRAYRTEWAGPKWVAALLRQARSVGYVTEASVYDGGYAVLDVFDEAGDIVQDFTIPNVRAFRWWYRKLTLRLESVDE